MKARANRSRGAVSGELPAAIAAMREPDRAMAAKLHAIVMAAAQMPKTWYGMPAYTLGRKVVCFFGTARQCKTRHAMLGCSDKAKLGDARCGRPTSRSRRWMPRRSHASLGC